MKCKQRFYKISESGHLKFTVAGWLILIFWTYFFSRLFYSLFSPADTFTETVDLRVIIIGLTGAFILFTGSWLIVASFHYTFRQRRQFRQVATRLWMEKIKQGEIPQPPVKKVLYNYTTWTTTVVYPDHTAFQAKFDMNISFDGMHFIFPTNINQVKFT